MPYTLQDIKKEIVQIQSAVDNLPTVVFQQMDVGKSCLNDLKIAALMYAPDHSLLYLCGLISKIDADLCQGEFRAIQRVMPSPDKYAKFARPYFKRIEELTPCFSDVFAKLQDGDLNLAPPIKNKFMKYIKNMRRAAALYELTFLNTHGLKYDLDDILPTPRQTAEVAKARKVMGVGDKSKGNGEAAQPIDALDENFNLLWPMALTVRGLRGKHHKAQALLGVAAIKHFCAAADCLCDVQEDAFNPFVQLRTRKMASYFKKLVPQTLELTPLQTRSVTHALIEQVRAALLASTHDQGWRDYLAGWYDAWTHPFVARQPKTILNGTVFNKIKLNTDLKKHLR